MACRRASAIRRDFVLIERAPVVAGRERVDATLTDPDPDEAERDDLLDAEAGRSPARAARHAGCQGHRDTTVASGTRVSFQNAER